MCVLAFAWRAHPRWQLVVAGNRDERHARPAAELARWPGEDHILAGRDLLSGGTWLGVSERGRFAVVTNVRGGPTDPAPRSRGALVADYLRGTVSYEDLQGDGLTQFNAFNLIVADCDQASFLSNRPDAAHELAPGLYGLANGALNAPWPKTLRLKSGVAEWLGAGVDDAEILLDLLGEESIDGTPDPDLDGSPIFIRNTIYGTRCSTIVLVDETGAGRMIERRFSAEGERIGETVLEFSW